MARPSKYETHVKCKLKQIQAWARDGLFDEQIANNLGIALTTFYEYKKKYKEFDEALKKGKEVVDIEVENALLKKALGYTVEEEVVEKKVIDGKEYASIKKFKKHIAGDTTAQIFWLKNRKPREWRDKQNIVAEINTNVKELSDEELKERLEELKVKLGLINE